MLAFMAALWSPQTCWLPAASTGVELLLSSKKKKSWYTIAVGLARAKLALQEFWVYGQGELREVIWEVWLI